MRSVRRCRSCSSPATTRPNCCSDNLLRTDSVIAKLVAAIPEADWQAVEIVGWLYQFYISEKKAEVIGKVVASEDIPAATQLFTPNRVVQYLVQDSVGRLWLMANPGSALTGRADAAGAGAARCADPRAHGRGWRQPEPGKPHGARSGLRLWAHHWSRPTSC